MGDDGALLWLQGRDDNPGSLELVASDGERFRLGNIQRAKKHGAARFEGEERFVLRGGDVVRVEGTLLESSNGAREVRVKGIAMPGFSLSGSPEERPPEAKKRRNAPASKAIGANKERTPRGEVRVLVGKARALGRSESAERAVLYGELTMTAGEETARETRDAGTIELVAEDGVRYRIEAIGSADRVGMVSLEGAYGELVSQPAARLFARKAPGDHVAVTIQGFAVCDGDTIGIEAELLPDVRFDGGAEGSGDFRSAPRAATVSARAIRVSIEQDPAESLRPSATSKSAKAKRETPPPARPEARVRYPLERSTLVYASLGVLLFFGSIAAGLVLPMESNRAALIPLSSMGTGFLLVALNRWLRAQRHASFVTLAGRGERKSERSAVWGYRVDAILLGIYAFGAVVTGLEPAPRYVTNTALALVALSLLHALLLALQERAFRRFASRVLSIDATDPRSGKQTFFEGTARGPSAPLDRLVEFYTSIEVTYTTLKDGSQRENQWHVVTDRQTTRARSFDVETANGSIRVDPTKAQVAFASREWIEDPIVSSYKEALREGSPVCVVARCESEGGALSARAGGDESMFLWAGSRSELAAALWAARARVALLVATGLLPAALGLALFPHAARYRATGVVTSSSLAGVSTGDRCTLSVLAYHYHRRPRCTVRLQCGGRALYGGYGMGQMDCAFGTSPRSTVVSGEDSSPWDGDDALRFDLSARSVTHESATNGAATMISLDPARPAIALW
jgi:hypothetical protein